MSNYEMKIWDKDRSIHSEIIESELFPQVVGKNYTLKNGSTGTLINVALVVNRDVLLKAIEDYPGECNE